MEMVLNQVIIFETSTPDPSFFAHSLVGRFVSYKRQCKAHNKNRSVGQ